MRLRQRIQGRSTLEAPVDASLRRLGQLVVVMGAMLGAVLGVALALLVENAETSRAVAAPRRERVAVLAASPPRAAIPSRPGGPCCGTRGMATIPWAASAPSRPTVTTSVMGRLTRTAKAAGTRPAAAARTDPARARTNSRTLPNPPQRVAIPDGGHDSARRAGEGATNPQLLSTRQRASSTACWRVLFNVCQPRFP
jgi:hypothetical protein